MKFLKLLGVVPFASAFVGVLCFNRVTPLVFGMPVLLVWCLFCVVLTSAIMGTASRLGVGVPTG
jgi:Protein of unknown function (DUF3311)